MHMIIGAVCIARARTRGLAICCVVVACSVAIRWRFGCNPFSAHAYTCESPKSCTLPSMQSCIFDVHCEDGSYGAWLYFSLFYQPFASRRQTALSQLPSASFGRLVRVAAATGTPHPSLGGSHVCSFFLDMMAARRKSNVVPVWRFLRNRCNGEGLQLQLRCTLALATLTTRALKRPSCTQSRRSIAPALTPFSFPLLLLFFFLSLFFFKNMKLNGMLSERAGFTTTPRITASLSGEGRPFRSL